MGNRKDAKEQLDLDHLTLLSVGTHTFNSPLVCVVPARYEH